MRKINKLRHLPGNWEICGDCRGEGASCAYLGAFTREQMEEDPEFFHDYMKGDYDRTCEFCGGSGKVWEVNEEALNDEQKAEYQEALDSDYSDYEWAQERKWEARMMGDWS